MMAFGEKSEKGARNENSELMPVLGPVAEDVVILSG